MNVTDSPRRRKAPETSAGGGKRSDTIPNLKVKGRRARERKRNHHQYHEGEGEVRKDQFARA